MKLRDYQIEIYKSVASSPTNDLVQLDTGAGKTPIEARLFKDAEYAMIVAHRNVLITQCSATVAKFGVEHDTISSEFTRRKCMQAHRHLGKNHIRRGHGKKIIASINSIISHYRRSKMTVDTSKQWLIIIDEAHHVVPDNMWGELKTIFTHARFIGFTATPGRMDGASLSVRNGGLFDRLVQCEWLRDESIKKLIESGMLSGYSAYSPQQHITNKAKSPALNIAISPVDAYKKYMPGNRVIVMCPAIKNAREISRDFIDSGISAGCISSDMSSSDIWRIIHEFVYGNINVLCNVDMVGEGFDVPAIDGIIICRFTTSFIMYRQWIGRVLRTHPGKNKAIIVDLVGVIEHHGEPDESVIWDIDNPPKTPGRLVTCPCHQCGLWYSVREKHCPECGELNKLLIGESVSTNHVSIKNLNMELINSARRELNEQQREHIKSQQLIIPEHRTIGGKIFNDVRVAFANELVNCGVSIREINRVLGEIEITGSQNFWTENFRASHAKQMPKNIALRAYKKCLKYI